MHPSRRARFLLLLDSAAGLTVGVLVVALQGWLAALYAMPMGLVMFIGVANVAYGSYSGRLAWLVIRGGFPSRGAINALVAANLCWSFVCVGLLVAYASSASVFGLGHVALEGLFVGALGLEERKHVRPFAR